ncbi:MAG: flagellar hook-basal body complex protein FliE [Fimbriimonadaceae bacterium]|jgi:flagellar hook-basal body complex protein FliE|nr:flagellar hook-basal body complex protein FliE [Fimbriimonadaceae bacterium]
MRINPALDKLNQIAQPLTPQVMPESGQDFGAMLMDAIKDVNATQLESRGLQNDLMAGRPVEYHDLMIAMERASTAMQLTMQVRNKALEAFQEINRMPL